MSKLDKREYLDKEEIEALIDKKLQKQLLTETIIYLVLLGIVICAL